MNKLILKLHISLFFSFYFLIPFFSSAQEAEKYFNRAYHYLSVDKAQAIHYLNECLKIDSNYVDAYFHRGITYFKQEEYRKALRDFDKTYEIAPDRTVIWMYRGFAYRNMGILDSALACFSNYISIHPQDTAAYSYILRGKMKYELGDFSGAVKDYDMALKLKPFEERYQYYRFVALSESGAYQQALQVVNRLIAINPDFYGYYFYKGSVFSDMKQYDSAIYMYNIAVIKNYQNADSYYYRGQAYQSQGRLKKAIEDYSTAIVLNPDDGTYYSKRGNCLYELGDKDGACKDWQEAGNLGYYEDYEKMKKLCKPEE